MHRPSFFLLCALVLGAGVVAAHALWFVASGFDLVTFVGATCVALGLGWASHASTVLGAARRAALAAWGVLIGWIVAIAVLVSMAPVDLVFSDLWLSEDGEHSIGHWLIVQFLPFAALVAAVCAPFGVAAWAYGALPRQRPLRLLPAMIALAPVTLWLFVGWDEGPLSVAGGVGALSWLVWALRRSRAVRARAALTPGDRAIVMDRS